MSIDDSFDAINEFGQSKVNDETCLQLLKSQIRETLCRIDGIVRPCLAFDDYEVVNKDVNAKRTFRIA